MQAYAGAFLCCECGLCTVYGCPMWLDPCRMNVEIKTRLQQQGFKYEPDTNPRPSEFFAIKQVPLPRLMSRLNLLHFDRRLELKPGVLRPRRVKLMLSHGPGAPARPVVKAGQKVKAGEEAASADGQVSAALHASIDGVVEAVHKDCVVLTAPGGKA